MQNFDEGHKAEPRQRSPSPPPHKRPKPSRPRRNTRRRTSPSKARWLAGAAAAPLRSSARKSPLRDLGRGRPGPAACCGRAVLRLARGRAPQLGHPRGHFPLDITGGMAQFQRQRCRCRRRRSRSSAAALGAGRARAAALSRRASRRSARARRRGIELTAQARVRERSVELVRAARRRAGAGVVRLRVDEALTLGWVRRPSTLLAHDLLCVLFGAIDAGAGGTVAGEGEGEGRRCAGSARSR